MRFAERVRLIGAGPIRSRGRGLGSASRFLEPSPQCALKVLEVQPRAWSKSFLVFILLRHLGAMTTHPDVAGRLEVRLIRDADDPLVPDEEVRAGLRAGPISVDLAALEEQSREGNVDMEKIEVWLKKFQDVEDVNQRSDRKGPLNNDDV
ncbi:hypothetical protein B0H14DRAFT_2969749 [Mycena olivaceomarginata]|nr:hypothetical protein B0H14DRAFT_2969749 [Mycena olivaceomarginata]